MSRVLVPISDQELARRWAAIRAGMQARGLDALVMQSANDWLGGYVPWFTDMPATNGYPRTILFFRGGGMTAIDMGVFGGRHAPGGADPVHRGVDAIVTTPAFLSVAYTHAYEGRLAVEALRVRGVRAVGLLGPGALPHGFARVLEDGLDGVAALTDETEWVDRIKAIKSAEETALIARTAALQDAVFARVLAGIRPGLRDVDVTALAQHEGQVLGAEQGIFLGGSSPLGRAAPFLPRHMQGRTLAPGDHLPLLIEINGPGGFYAEIARTIVLGRASQEVLDGFASVEEAQRHTLSLLRPGVAARDVAASHDAWMAARGLPAELRLYSHGQGYDMVERPLIRSDETMTIEAGMCLAVHPGYQTERLFAVICDNYMVEAGGPGPCLHRTEKRVFEVES